MKLRTATAADLVALDQLIRRAMAQLLDPVLTPAQVAASHAVMGLDRQLVEDGTYVLVQDGRRIVGCGGWSDRVTLFGGDHSAGCLTVRVDDDGPGIPVDQREAVFRPFYRLDEARNLDQSGTGLGLSIARDVARVHGGDITLEDSPLGGLRVTVKIPG